MPFKKNIITAGLILVLSVDTLYASPWLDTELLYDGGAHRYSAEAVNLYVNDVYLENLPMPPVIIDSVTLVPAREVFERLGAVVDWNPGTEEVYILYDGRVVVLKINDNYANVNGEQLWMPVPPKIINNKTMIPVRFTSEAFGLSVDWNNDTRDIKINTRPVTPLYDTPEPDYPITKITSIIVPDCNLNPYFYINAESEISSYKEDLSDDGKILTIDIENSLPTLKTSEYSLPINNYVNFIAAETLNSALNIYTTRVKFELAVFTRAEVTLSADRKSITLFFMNTQAVPSETEAEIIRFNDDFWYDKTNGQIIINKACGIYIDVTAIRHTADSLNGRYSLLFHGTHGEFLENGMYDINDSYITGIDVNNGIDGMEFIINEKIASKYEVTEDANYIYISRTDI